MRSCVDSSKARVQRLLTERHLLIRKVGQLEDALTSPMPTQKSRPNSPAVATMDNAVSLNHLKAMLDKTEKRVQNERDSEMVSSQIQEVATSQPSVQKTEIAEECTTHKTSSVNRCSDPCLYYSQNRAL